MKTNLQIIFFQYYKMSLDIVLGPMFSGKSSHAMSYIRRQRAIGRKVFVIKPSIDVRYSNDHVLITHDKENIPCRLWDINEALSPVTDAINSDCIVIEEAQFFKGLKNFVVYMLRSYKQKILIVGLDGDARQNSFGEIFDCIPYAKTVTKLTAFCVVCADETLAVCTKKKNENGSQIDIGGSEMYMPVCLKHL